MTFAPPPTLPPDPPANPEAVASPYVLQGLKRLRQIAAGNGIDPEALRLLEATEAQYQLQGFMSFQPIVEKALQQYTGPIRNNKSVILPNTAALQADMQAREEDFTRATDWIEDARIFLSKLPGGGFGQTDLRIDLPERTVTLAASSPCPTCEGNQLLICPQCQSQGQVTCTHCQGQRQETCPTCLGRGNNPTQPDQPCPTCNRQGRVPCRYCNASGYLTCPTCRGKRGIPCKACNGTGKVTAEVTLTFCLRTSFRVTGEGVPSGLRRGLDRLGLSNLYKGHATIRMLDDRPAPAEDETEDVVKTPAEPVDPYAAHWGDETEARAEELPEEQEQEIHIQKAEIRYIADMPYADLRMDLAGKKCMVNLFGLRGALLSVPAFLDEVVEPALETLRQAAKGNARIESALGFRLMRDVLALQLQSKGTPQELRKLYPLGLSPEMGKNILQAMRQSLNKLTLRIRSAVAIGSVLLSSGIFAGIFDTPLHHDLTHGWPLALTAAFDFGLLITASVVGWLALSVATRLWLSKRFPDTEIPTVQHTGKTGYAMIGGIVVLFLLTLIMAGQKTGWLGALLEH